MTTKLVKNTEKLKRLQTSSDRALLGHIPKVAPLQGGLDSGATPPRGPGAAIEPPLFSRIGKKQITKAGTAKQAQKRVKVGDICDLKVTALGPNNIGIDEFSFPFAIFVPNVKYGTKIRAKIVKIAVSFSALNVSKKPISSFPLGEELDGRPRPSRGLVGPKSSLNSMEDVGTIAYAVAQLMGPLPTSEGSSVTPLEARPIPSQGQRDLRKGLDGRPQPSRGVMQGNMLGCGFGAQPRVLGENQQEFGEGAKRPVTPGDVLTVSIKKITPAENFVLGLGGFDIYKQKAVKKNNTNPSSLSSICAAAASDPQNLLTAQQLRSPAETENSPVIASRIIKGKGSVGMVELENNFTLIVPLGASAPEESLYENIKVMVTRIKHNYGFATS